jgi:hypothetical protein
MPSWRELALVNVSQFPAGVVNRVVGQPLTIHPRFGDVLIFSLKIALGEVVEPRRVTQWQDANPQLQAWMGRRE